MSDSDDILGDILGKDVVDVARQEVQEKERREDEENDCPHKLLF